MSTTPYASEAFLHQLLGKALAAQACDVHLKVGQPPGARVRGDMVYFRVEKIRPEDTEAAVKLIIGGVSTGPAGADPRRAGRVEGAGSACSPTRRAAWGGSASPSTASADRSRWCCGACRAKVPTLDELGLPAAVKSLVDPGRGLVVVAGGAAQGRTTTIAAMVAHLNESAARHLISLEDPIELLHEDAREREASARSGPTSRASRWACARRCGRIRI